MQKMNFGIGKITSLANSEDEWISLKGAVETPFVRCLDDWDDFVSSEEVKNSVLGKLSQTDLMIFRSHLQFDEVTRNGKPYLRGCAGWYYGDLVEEHNFTEEQLFEVAALFGVGKDRFLAVRDKFGDICNGNTCCRPRTAYTCPDGKPNCTC